MSYLVRYTFPEKIVVREYSTREEAYKMAVNEVLSVVHDNLPRYERPIQQYLQTAFHIMSSGGIPYEERFEKAYPLWLDFLWTLGVEGQTDTLIPSSRHPDVLWTVEVIDPSEFGELVTDPDKIDGIENYWAPYRGISWDEFLTVMALGHWPEGSLEPMSGDPEIFKLVAPEAWYSEEDLEEWLKEKIPWEPNQFGSYDGLNLTGDLENAAGYGYVVVAVNCGGPVADFGFDYALAGRPDLCSISAFSLPDGRWYIPN